MKSRIFWPLLFSCALILAVAILGGGFREAEVMTTTLSGWLRNQAPRSDLGKGTPQPAAEAEPTPLVRQIPLCEKKGPGFHACMFNAGYVVNTAWIEAHDSDHTNNSLASIDVLRDRFRAVPSPAYRVPYWVPRTANGKALPVEGTNSAGKVPVGFAIETAAPGGACNIDAINGVSQDMEKIAIGNGEPIVITAWAAISVKDGTLPDEALLALRESGGKTRFAVFSRAKREDVVAYFNNSKLLDSGLVATQETAGFQPGNLLLEIYMRTRENTYRCQIAKTIRIL